MKKIVLIGGGGHCKVVIDILTGNKIFKISGIIDNKLKNNSNISNVPVIGKDSNLTEIFNKGMHYCFVAIGATAASTARAKIYDMAKKIGYKLPVIVSTNALVSKNTIIGEGTIVANGAIINPGATIGKNCIINTGAIIEHDCKIGNHVHIAPGVTLSGGVSIGDFSHVGTGSTIIQGISIGSNTTIGAGSTVVNDISSNSVAFGNPCKKQKVINAK